MRFCMKCGNQIMNDDQQFCSNCGAKIYNQSNTIENCENNSCQYGQQSVYSQDQRNVYQFEQQSPYQQVQTYPQNPYHGQSGMFVQYPMKWFKFLIYFSLFFGAVINIVFGLNYVTGGIYFVQSNGDVTADLIYELFGNGLKALDVIFGLLMVAVGVFGIYTRFRLSKYKRNGPLCVYILYGVSPVLTLIYNIGVGVITGLSDSVSVSSFTSIAVAVALIFANYKYFTKRKELFVN